jgi:sec-independent protein translocase protein TatB
VFGVSFSEMLMLGVVALLAVGPKKLPQALGTLGQWAAKLRRISSEVRYQMGLDDLLRREGLTGGVNELRSLMRGGLAGVMTQPSPSAAPRSNYTPAVATDSREVADDRSREYPNEGCDAYGAIPDDLLPDPEETKSESKPEPAPQTPVVTH